MLQGGSLNKPSDQKVGEALVTMVSWLVKLYTIRFFRPLGKSEVPSSLIMFYNSTITP